MPDNLCIELLARLEAAAQPCDGDDDRTSDPTDKVLSLPANKNSPGLIVTLAAAAYRPDERLNSIATPGLGPLLP